jgi:hypothetical protein
MTDRTLWGEPLAAPLALILCADGRLVRLLETELAYLGIEARSTPSLPPPDGELCLLVADGDGFDPMECAELAAACGCPLLLFGRELRDPAALPVLADFLRRPFALSALEQAVRSLLTEIPARGSPVGMSRHPAAPEAAPPPPSAPALAVVDGTVTLNGKPLPLTPAEQAILTCLCARRGETVTREELSALLGGGGNSVDVYVCRLRAKIEKPLGRRMIQTLRGVGYRLET